MTAIILRRRKLGRTSCREIARLSHKEIAVWRNDRPMPRIEQPYHPVDKHLYPVYIFRWGCTSEVGGGEFIKIVNKAEAISGVSNKRDFRLLLDEKEIGDMITWDCADSFYDDGKDYPVVVRPEYHHQGRNLHVCREINELQRIEARYGIGHYYISPLIKKTAEYRVGVVQGRAVWVVSKTPANPNDVAWNVFQGGRFDNLHWKDWPLKAVKIALEAFRLSKLDFGGVDVMVDKDGKVYVLEINAAPSLTSPYRQECFAKAFDYIIDHGKEPIPLIEAKGGYRKFVHPAIDKGALIP